MIKKGKKNIWQEMKMDNYGVTLFRVTSKQMIFFSFSCKGEIWMRDQRRPKKTDKKNHNAIEKENRDNEEKSLSNNKKNRIRKGKQKNKEHMNE